MFTVSNESFFPVIKGRITFEIHRRCSDLIPSRWQREVSVNQIRHCSARQRQCGHSIIPEYRILLQRNDSI